MEKAMRSRIVVIACLHFLIGNGLSVVIDRHGDAYPVYQGNHTAGNRTNTPEDVYYPGTEFEDWPENEKNQTSNATNGLLMSQYEKCLQSKGFLDCLKFKSFKFLKDLFDPVTPNNISDVLRSQSILSRTEPLLIGLPPPNGTAQSVLVRTMHRAFGGSGSMEIFQFLVEQLDDFLSRHGFVITVRNVQGVEPIQLDSPWLIDFDHGRERRSATSNSRKVKKKEYAIVFPMLVLFKFLKIKMLLVPILLGVIFLKKLLILTLTLLPYLIGLFGCCRRPPFLGPIQSAGLLQEVDTRGEFTSNLGYSFPYREGFSFRQKERGRPSEAYADY